MYVKSIIDKAIHLINPVLCRSLFDSIYSFRSMGKSPEASHTHSWAVYLIPLVDLLKLNQTA